MRHLSLWIPFGLAFFFGTVGTALFPEIRVWAFAPFLAILFHRVAFSKALWISFFLRTASRLSFLAAALWAFCFKPRTRLFSSLSRKKTLF